VSKVKHWILPDVIRCTVEMEQGLRQITELLLNKMEELQRAQAGQIAGNQEEMSTDINAEVKAL
jgi:hypothetical protein